LTNTLTMTPNNSGLRVIDDELDLLGQLVPLAG